MSEKTIPQLTTWFLVAMSIAIILYDIWAGGRYGNEGTVSHWVLYYSRGYPIVAFALGLLFGHLLWPQR